MSYDSKCFALAEAMMKDHRDLDEEHRKVYELAQRIQDAIDDFMEELTGG